MQMKHPSHIETGSEHVKQLRQMSGDFRAQKFGTLPGKWGELASMPMYVAPYSFSRFPPLNLEKRLICHPACTWLRSKSRQRYFYSPAGNHKLSPCRNIPLLSHRRQIPSCLRKREEKAEVLRLQSGADLFLEYHVTGIYRCGAAWEVERKGGKEKFDAVVLTMPVPQILQLQGDLRNSLSVQQKEQLEGVRYSSRFAVALFFSPEVVFRFTWGARYFSESPCIRYIAVDNKKRSADTPGLGPSLVVHTSVPFGMEHLENDKEAIQPIILQELHRLLPDLPQPISIKFQKWRYSQVLTSVPNCPGQITVLEQPPLICGGDAFTHSNFDGCVESALSVIRALKAIQDVQQSTVYTL